MSRVRSPPTTEHKNIHCFSANKFPEIARRTAEWLGVDIQFIKMDEEALAARFEETVWHSEIPLPDLNGMGRLALAEAVHSQGIKVVVTGESIPS